MLKALGRPGTDRAKSIAIGVLAGLLLLALWQLETQSALATREDQSRQVAVNVAQRFAIALTTYDYAHPNVQLVTVAAVSSVAVQERVRAAASDVAAAKASSLGGVTDAIVTNLTASKASVLLETIQVIGGSYAETGTTLRGLLEVTVGQPGGGWVVVDFRWLVALSGIV
jgi:hypothetical protein